MPIDIIDQLRRKDQQEFGPVLPVVHASQVEGLDLGTPPLATWSTTTAGTAVEEFTSFRAAFQALQSRSPGREAGPYPTLYLNALEGSFEGPSDIRGVHIYSRTRGKMVMDTGKTYVQIGKGTHLQNLDLVPHIDRDSGQIVNSALQVYPADEGERPHTGAVLENGSSYRPATLLTPSELPATFRACLVLRDFVLPGVSGTGNVFLFGTSVITAKPPASVRVYDFRGENSLFTDLVFASGLLVIPSGTASGYRFSQVRNLRLKLEGSTSIAFSGGVGQVLPGTRGTYIITQDATGGHTLTFPTPAHSQPAVNPAPNSVTLIEWLYDGVRFYYKSFQL